MTYVSAECCLCFTRYRVFHERHVENVQNLHKEYSGPWDQVSTTFCLQEIIFDGGGGDGSHHLLQ